MSDRLAIVGLSVALLGMPAAILIAGALRLDRWLHAVRWMYWGIATALTAIAMRIAPEWRSDMGLDAVNAWTLPTGVAVASLMLLVFPLIQRAGRRLAGFNLEYADAFRKVANLSVGHRWFIVVTAGCVEEWLYRGYAIGIGAGLLGSTWGALALSVFAFAVAHLRWGFGHLIYVLWAACVLSALFLRTHDLFACIIAHIAVDAFGFIVAPAVNARRKRALSPSE